MAGRTSRSVRSANPPGSGLVPACLPAQAQCHGPGQRPKNNEWINESARMRFEMMERGVVTSLSSLSSLSSFSLLSLLSLLSLFSLISLFLFEMMERGAHLRLGEVSVAEPVDVVAALLTAWTRALGSIGLQRAPVSIQ